MRKTKRHGALRWLRCDLHTHCEDHGMVEAHLQGAAERLDVVALTNHAQKPIFFEQHAMVERARRLMPEGLVLFGMEWNAPLGVHANLVFPPGPNEAEHAYAFARTYDRLGSEGTPTPEGALEALAALPHDERPVLFFNHPSPGQWSSETIARYLRADRGGVIVGIEALHGHQLHAKVAALDPFVYPGSAAGGLCDDVYAQERPFALLAHSDFHVHKMSSQPDYSLGVFNHTRAGVAPDCWTAADFFAALRGGRSCAAQGHWLELRDFCLGDAQMGDAQRANDDPLRIAFASDEAVGRVELIGRLSASAPAAVLHDFGPLSAGAHALEWDVPAGATGFVRLRIAAASHRRPEPGPDGPKLFQTAAIILAA